ncbi:phosphopyruvate hydratase [Desulfofundulus thermobenzoicus]|uniref:Enolase n=1 Tax=Desulfofundulus thermobenzoicus TaxID=29376 RepID=A0A6N7IU91_9FIRM|nr:phosphopyruvate hydratase [Desulfofundulus thermobenzoicus]MQL53123.1 phosphopyruvate hydratase [Desulfofundulus thermobenzoicus]
MSRPIIKEIKYRTVFDSRGVETLEVDVFVDGGFGRAAAPFGAPGSRGEFEAPAYSPEGLDGSIKILNQFIIPSLIGMDASEQHKIDELLKQIDGTPNFERIGGNTSVVISTACAKAAADALNMPLFKLMAPEGPWSMPLPLGNVIGGGAHSMGPAPDMQEHLVVAVGAKTIKEAIKLNLMVHEEVGKLLEKRDPGFAGGTDDENAWTANLDDVQALEVLGEACRKVSQRTGVEIRMGLDLAADRLWDPEKKVYRYWREGCERTTREQLDFLCELIERFNLIYVEDAFNSNDYESFSALNKRCGDRCIICADDLYASNPERTRAGITARSAGAMIVKPNQVGTITGAHITSQLAKENGLKIILSHRSGETMDDSIAHLAVAWKATMIKTGVKGGERLAKLNELIRIEQSYKEMVIVQGI